MDGAVSTPLTQEQQRRLEDGLYVKGYSARASLTSDGESATVIVYNIEEPVTVTLPLAEFIQFVREASRALVEKGHLKGEVADAISRHP